MVGIDLPDSFEEWAALATSVGVVVALVGLIVNATLTRRGQKQDAEHQAATAARAEAAAALTEEYTRRVVEALEALADKPAGIDPAHAAPQRVRWSLVNWSGDTYQLTNDGTADARNVRVSAHDSLMFDEPEPQDLAAGEALTFLAVATLATSDMTIRVTWADDAGEHEWRYPLPPRPPRR